MWTSVKVALRKDGEILQLEQKKNHENWIQGRFQAISSFDFESIFIRAFRSDRQSYSEKKGDRKKTSGCRQYCGSRCLIWFFLFPFFIFHFSFFTFHFSLFTLYFSFHLFTFHFSSSIFYLTNKTCLLLSFNSFEWFLIAFNSFE